MTSTEVETRPEDIAAAVGVPVGALAIREDQTELTPAQRAALGHIGLANAPAGDVEAFLHLCQRTQLDPWARQIYLIERGGKWTPQTAIDGFRVIASRQRPIYRGQTPIEWCGEDGRWTDVWLSTKPPHAARCGVIRSDEDQPVTAVVNFAEFTAGNAKWRTSPAHMIGKCAEAGALRRAFPQDFAGLVIDEEAQALTAQGRRTRVESTRDTGPVEVGELTGERPPAEPPAPGASTGLPGGAGKATAAHTKRLMAATRRQDAPENVRAWAEATLDRDIRSWGVLTADQANTLIEKLEAGPPEGGWHVVEVVEPEPAAPRAETAPAAAEDDDHADEYAQLEAERDAAAQGDA